MIEWLSHDAIIEAPDAASAEAEARRLWAENAEHEVFSWRRRLCEEELVAELGSAFLCADLGLTPEVREDHAAYIAKSITLLKDEKRAIFSAAAHAQRAADDLHGLQPQQERPPRRWPGFPPWQPRFFLVAGWFEMETQMSDFDVEGFVATMERMGLEDDGSAPR